GFADETMCGGQADICFAVTRYLVPAQLDPQPRCQTYAVAYGPVAAIPATLLSGAHPRQDLARSLGKIISGVVEAFDLTLSICGIALMGSLHLLGGHLEIIIGLPDRTRGHIALGRPFPEMLLVILMMPVEPLEG